jgi:phosphate transport system substrate-binding protein
MRLRKIAGALALCALVAGGTAHAKPEMGSPLVGTFCSAGGAIIGTGSTLVNNAMSNVFIPAYNTECGKGTIAYTATGSAAGKAAILNRTAAWGGSDDPLGVDEWVSDMADASGAAGRVSPIHHIPLAIAAVTVDVNLASCGITASNVLKLTSTNIAEIYMGLITKWNDAAITGNNAQLSSCNKAIKLVARGDGSGSTYALKDYLSKRMPAPWNAYKQPALNTAWPAEDLGLASVTRGTGGGGVAAAVKANDGAIGYVDLATAKKNLLTWAKVDSLSTEFNAPNAGAGANCTAAASGAVFPPSTLLPGWDALTMTDTPVSGVYGICTFTYALVYNDLHSAYGASMSTAQAQTLVDFMGLAVSSPVQAKLNAAGYDALPDTLLQIARVGVATINLN